MQYLYITSKKKFAINLLDNIWQKNFTLVLKYFSATNAFQNISKLQMFLKIVDTFFFMLYHLLVICKKSETYDFYDFLYSFLNYKNCFNTNDFNLLISVDIEKSFSFWSSLRVTFSLFEITWGVSRSNIGIVNCESPGEGESLSGVIS